MTKPGPLDLEWLRRGPLGVGDAERLVAEIERLRALIADAVVTLDLIEPDLAAACQHATENNIDLRVGLLILRTLVANLKSRTGVEISKTIFEASGVAVYDWTS